MAGKDQGSNEKIKIPKHALKLKLDHVYPENRSQNYTPSLKVIWDMLPLILRYIWYYISYKLKGKSIVMDYVAVQKAKQIYGVPIGGIGCGTIGRGFRGEFCRFQLKPGLYEWNTVDADQFIVTIKDKNQETIFQSLLSAFKINGLKSWESLIDPSKCNFTGLYPRSWTEFNLSEYGIKLICRQVSPVIPHDYESTSLPCAIFVWEIQNVGDEERYVTISFTFKNGTGDKKLDKDSTSSSKSFSYLNSEGVILYHTIDKMPCSYTLAAKQTDDIHISKCLYFDPRSDGSKVWSQLKANGKFDKVSEKSHGHIFGEMACGVAAKTSISPSSSKEIEMALVWDMPCIHFPANKQKKYYRFYSEKFGKENAALKIVDFAFKNYGNWEQSIYDWQEGVQNDDSLPDWYKSALFNETYFVSDGGSIWLAPDEDMKGLSDHDPRRKYGRFAYLEGHEYRMYNSFDVHFYASHALHKNWPQLQRSLHYDLKDFVFVKITEKRKMLYDGEYCQRKYRDSVPHDAGDPGEEPIILINAYPIHNVRNWRDLNPKFVLQSFRDAVATETGVVDVDYMRDMYDACHVVMEKSLRYDVDGDGVIENSGLPDQTFDTWVMTGTSAYCGGLWLAALYAMTVMAETLGKIEDQQKYLNLLERGKKSFERKLWNGKYYNYDCSEKSGTAIMADQLNGHMYLRCCGVDDYAIFPKNNVRTALKTIYENNVQSFCDGTMGAVNGIINDTVDTVTIQSQEVWTGVTYALAATMIQEDMVDEAFKTAGGMYSSMADKFGLAYDTPEALYAEKYYRAIGYMRPLSIWSMQIALEQKKSNNR